MMKKRICLALAVIMVLSLVACAETPPKTTPAETKNSTEAPKESTAPTEETVPEPVKKFFRRYDANCTTFNPHMANSDEDVFNEWCMARCYRPWTDGDGVQYWRPELAESDPVQMDADGLVWHIVMKDNACFDDGTPITAKTIEYSVKMAADPKLAQRAGDQLTIYITPKYLKEYYKGEQVNGKDVTWDMVGVKAIDDKTLEITCSVAASAELIKKAYCGYSTEPVDPDLYEACMSADRTSTSYGSSVETTKYSGAFRPTTWIRESKIIVEKNEKYVYADEVHITDAELIYVDNAQTRVELFENGELDYASINAEIGVQYIDSPNYFTIPSRYLLMIEINDNTAYYKAGEKTGEVIRVENDASQLKQPILSNMNFKNALWYAIDRVTLAKLECGYPANFIIPLTSYCGEGSSMRFRDTDAALAYVEDINDSFNPELAKEYLEKALKEVGQDSAELSLVTNSGNAEMNICATFLQEQFHQIFDGKLELKINEVPNETRLATMKDWRINLNSFELGLSNWSRAATDSSPMNQLDVFSSSYWEKCNAPYHCETIEKLIWEQDTNPAAKQDPDYNIELAAKMEKAALEERIVIPMFERTSQFLLKENIIPNDGDPWYWCSWLFDIDTTK